MPEFFGAIKDGRNVDAQVVYMLPGGQFGIEAGYCVLGIDLIPF